LFTPSRRALAGSAGRKRGEAVSPASVKMAERRLISSLLLDADAERCETLDTAVAGGAKALTAELAANNATEIRFRGDMIISKLFSAAAAVFVSSDYERCEEGDDRFG